MRVTASRIVENRSFNLSIKGLIVLALVSFSIDTLPDLHPTLRQALEVVELLCVAVFSVEYVLRLVASRPMQSYAFSFFGIIDLAAILPFYLLAGFDRARHHRGLGGAVRARLRLQLVLLLQ